MVGALALGAAAVVPATASAAAPGAHRLGGRTLRQGMHGSDVRLLQRDLTQSGFATRASGAFSAATTRTVESFERRYHLAVDGVATHHLVHTLLKIRTLDLAAVGADSGTGGGGLGAPTVSTTTSSTTGTTTEPGEPTVAATTTPTITSPAYGKRTLHKGMTGSDVEALQGYLTLAGFQTAVDGQFGPKTRRSVIAFEQANDLVPANGVVTRSQALLLKSDVAKAVTASGATATATLNSDGTVTPPAGAPAAVIEAIDAANSIIDTPYIYGGGHASFTDTGYDCSGAVSFALHGAGLLSAPEDSSDLESFGLGGPGQWITVYSDPEHAFVVIAGLAFDTAHFGPTFPGGSGPRWLPAADVLANLSDGGSYITRHPAGL